MKKHSLRFLAALVGLAAAAVSNAAIISFQWKGPVTEFLPGLNSASSTSVDNDTSIADFNIGSVAYYYTNSGPSVGNGIVSLLGDPSSSIQFNFAGTADAQGMNGYVMSFQNGTGALAGYQGNGVLSHTNDEFGPGIAGGQFDAELAPVPEPASLAVLGLGAIGLIRRSRKTAR